MLAWVAHLVAAGGYWGVGLLMAIENVVLPLPSELIMPLAGFAAARGEMSLSGVIIAGTIGSVIGSLPMYLPARWFGEERVAKWIARHGKWLFLNKRDVDRAAERFKRGGFVAVFVAQLLPGVRGLISLPAGFASMNIVLFLLANLAGTLIWCTALAYAGQELGANYDKVDKYVGSAGLALLGAALVGGIAWLAVRRRRKSR
jgi:LPXTG-motif cell wall-anchored protein